MAASRVMLVDDEEDIIWGLSRVLTSAGYDVITASDAETALAKLSTQPVDILITDIKMPGKSGLDLILEARKLYSSIRAVVMTARGSEELQRETMERGALEYIEKPFDIDMFLETLAKAKTEGFRGVVRDLKLVDVLQILSLEGATAEVQVSAPAGSGSIYFVDGKVVHAVFGKQVGEEAFYAILGLEGGSFSLRRGSKTKERTIEKSLDNLMLTAYADKDEASASEGSGLDLGDFDLESFSLSAAVGLTEETAELVIPEELKKRLEQALEELLVEGVEAAAIWDNEARVAALKGEISAQAVKHLATTITHANTATGALGKGNLSEVLLTTPSGNIVMRQLAGGRFSVGLVADSKANPGLLRVNLIKSAMRLEKLLAEIPG